MQEIIEIPLEVEHIGMQGLCGTRVLARQHYKNAECLSNFSIGLCRTRISQKRTLKHRFRMQKIIEIPLEVEHIIMQGIMRDSSSGTSTLQKCRMSQQFFPSDYAGLEFRRNAP